MLSSVQPPMSLSPLSPSLPSDKIASSARPRRMAAKALTEAACPSGGGFLALMAADGTSQAEIESTVMRMRSEESDMNGFKWHSCTVATEGLVIDV